MSTNKTRALEEMMGLPFDEWGKTLEDVQMTYKHETDSVLQDMEHVADMLATRAAMLSEYVSKRGGDGTGDAGHEAAMKSALKTAKRIRRVLGYS